MSYKCLKYLFTKNGFKKSLKEKTREELEKFFERAVKEEEYEMASYIDMYLKFKYNKNNVNTIKN